MKRPGARGAKRSKKASVEEPNGSGPCVIELPAAMKVNELPVGATVYVEQGQFQTFIDCRTRNDTERE